MNENINEAVGMVRFNEDLRGSFVGNGENEQRRSGSFVLLC